MLCSICLEFVYLGDGSIVKKCRHIFHTHCLIPWLHSKSSPTCPCCRHPIQTRDDISLLEKIYLTSEKGCILNGYQFFPTNIQDLKLCLLYIFLIQTGIFFHYIPSDIETKIGHIFKLIMENIHEKKETPWQLLFINFFKQNPLQIEFGSNHPKPINLADIYLIYFSNRENCGYLNKSIGYHGQQGILQNRCECHTIG